jgi:hypothetical protein
MPGDAFTPGPGRARPPAAAVQTRIKCETYYGGRDVSLRQLRLVSLIGMLAVLALLVILALIARLDIKPAPAASAQVPAPLATGTELQKPRPVPSCR